MPESVAKILGLAVIIPDGVILVLYFVFYGQLIRQLRDVHTPLWVALGQPALLWGGSRGSLVRLIGWISARGYLAVQNVRTTTLGARCRLVYRGMIAVVLWMAATMILGNVLFRR